MDRPTISGSHESDAEKRPAVDHGHLHPSRDDRCAECGVVVGDEWVSYRQDPTDPQSVVRHFAAIVSAGPVEPKPDRPKRTIRDFRYPEDVGVFFHPSCAPRVELPEKLQEEIAELIAKALVADYEKSVVRWAKVHQLTRGEVDLLRLRVHVASVGGRRIFTMTRGELGRFWDHEGKLIEIDLELTPIGMPQAASVIASLAADCPVDKTRIEIWRYNEQKPPGPHNVEEYLVLETLTPRRVNLRMFAERASTQDSPALRKYLRDHVFFVKEQPDKGRWDAKGRRVERLVFLKT